MADPEKDSLAELQAMSKDELIAKLMRTRKSDNSSDREKEDRLRQVQAEAQRREKVLFMKLTSKEQDVQEYLSQVEELRTSLGSGLRNALLDPVVNAVFQKMKEELNQARTKLNEAQQESAAWKFTPDSTTGKRLMGKCRSLIQENEELGKIIETGRLARLEGELELNRKQADEFKSGQTEMENLLVELDEDMDGLQTTVMFLQKQLEEARRENQELRQMLGDAESSAPRKNYDYSSNASEELHRNVKSPSEQQNSASARTRENPSRSESALSNVSLEEMDTQSKGDADEREENTSPVCSSHENNRMDDLQDKAAAEQRDDNERHSRASSSREGGQEKPLQLNGSEAARTESRTEPGGGVSDNGCRDSSPPPRKIPRNRKTGDSCGSPKSPGTVGLNGDAPKSPRMERKGPRTKTPGEEPPSLENGSVGSLSPQY